MLGLDTFGDLIHDDRGRPLSHAQTIRSVVEQGVLADEVGVDFFGIGEHHTGDFPMRDCVEALGGTIAIQSPEGAGTTVEVALPLDSDVP